ncbi:MAG: hypothetical protein PHH84_00430 [Oscillospiraceae bacterium]|nr:hypothetical protein [Oscillospiraceae bacterium]MDD4413079.1 hypothetical protein [Oscillospiraceae bacterium]
MMLIGFLNDCGIQTADQTDELKAELALAQKNSMRCCCSLTSTMTTTQS